MSGCFSIVTSNYFTDLKFYKDSEVAKLAIGSNLEIEASIQTPDYFVYILIFD